MSSPVLDLLAVYFNEELIDERPNLRSSLYNGGPEGVESTRAEFADLLRKRTMTSDDFWRATSVYFASDENLYRALDKAYGFFFEEAPAQ